MDREEAKLIVQELRSGKRYATRFHEEEWGIDYLDEDRFREWGRRADLSGRTNGDSFENTLSEEGVIELLLAYDYRQTRGGLR